MSNKGTDDQKVCDNQNDSENLQALTLRPSGLIILDSTPSQEAKQQHIVVLHIVVHYMLRFQPQPVRKKNVQNVQKRQKK